MDGRGQPGMSQDGRGRLGAAGDDWGRPGIGEDGRGLWGTAGHG